MSDAKPAPRRLRRPLRVSLDDATHAGLDTLSEALKLPVSRVIDQLVEAELKRRARRATT